MSKKTFGDTGTLNAYVVSPIEVQVGDRYGYKVIAAVHDERYWCAYKMPTNVPDSEWTDQGVEVPYEVARLLFPALDNTDREYYNP